MKEAGGPREEERSFQERKQGEGGLEVQWACVWQRRTWLVSEPHVPISYLLLQFFEELAVEDKQAGEEEKVLKEKEQPQQQQQVLKCQGVQPTLVQSVNGELSVQQRGPWASLSYSLFLSAAKKETRHPKRPAEEGRGR